MYSYQFQCMVAVFLTISHYQCCWWPGACITVIRHCYKPLRQWRHNFQMKAALPLANRLVRASDCSRNTGSCPIFDLWLNKVLAYERWHYICNVVSHWLKPCSFTGRKQALVMLNPNNGATSWLPIITLCILWANIFRNILIDEFIKNRTTLPLLSHLTG